MISEEKTKKKGLSLDWKDLYFPIGCGMVKGGLMPNVPIVQHPDGTFAVSCVFYVFTERFFQCFYLKQHGTHSEVVAKPPGNPSSNYGSNNGQNYQPIKPQTTTTRRPSNQGTNSLHLIAPNLIL